MTKKNTNKTGILIALFVVLILALGIGYAAFSDTLRISGTANAGGKFDLEFTNASALVSSQGVRTTGADATGVAISADGNTLTVTVADLAYPGAGAQFQAVIKNVGTVPAKVKGLTQTTNNTTGADSIKITGLNVIDDEHSIIEPNGTCTINFTVQWDPTKDLTNSEGDTVSFELGIEYEQATTAFEGQTSHTDSNP